MVSDFNTCSSLFFLIFNFPFIFIGWRWITLQYFSVFCHTDVQNRLLDSVGKGEGGMFWEDSIKTCILSRVKQTTSAGWMHETSARAWCTGKTQRDWVEREVGVGIRMGNTCKSMADSHQCMTKTTTCSSLIPSWKCGGEYQTNPIHIHVSDFRGTHYGHFQKISFKIPS